MGTKLLIMENILLGSINLPLAVAAWDFFLFSSSLACLLKTTTKQAPDIAHPPKDVWISSLPHFSSFFDVQLLFMVSFCSLIRGYLYLCCFCH